MTLEYLEKCKYGLTHAGTFHADDVFSAAFILLINPDIKIIRKSEVNPDFKGIIFDIGGGEFDHHSSNNEIRDNGIPYASFGKLWKKFAKLMYGDYVYKSVDKKLIQMLDLADNTGCSDTLSIAISSFNPIQCDATGDNEFMMAVNVAKEILINIIKKEKINESEEMQVKIIYKKSLNKKIIVLDKYLHFKDCLAKTAAMYVIFPSKRGGYLAQAVPINGDTVELKKPFPKEWTQTLPPYLTFCHNSRFLIGAKTVEDLVLACKIALEDN